MADYTLVPVDHQPDFGGVSLVPVDYDPFGAGGATQPPPLQLAQPVLQPAQPQPASPRLESSTQQPPAGVGQPNVVASTVGAQTTAPMQLNPYPAGYPTDDSSYGPSIINAVRGMFNPSFDEDKRIVSGIYDAAKDAVLAPGRLMQPNPYPPGSEEASWYENQRQRAMIPAATNIATLLAGFGLPMAESGAVGALGGKLSRLGTESPKILPEELAGQTRTQIRDLAVDKGLVPKGDTSHPDYPRRWSDPVTNERRLRLDRGHVDSETKQPYDEPNAAVDHVHAYDVDGNPITINDDNHIPTTGE
jgi:hypothetical protein